MLINEALLSLPLEIVVVDELERSCSVEPLSLLDILLLYGGLRCDVVVQRHLHKVHHIYYSFMYLYHQSELSLIHI